MNTIPLKPERQAELEKFAMERGKPPADALDDAIAAYLEWQRQDFQETVEAVREGYEEMREGKGRLAGDVLADVRRKYDLPR
jgi:predicted transcriptional regulator